MVTSDGPVGLLVMGAPISVFAEGWDQIRAGVNAKLDIGGIVMTMYDSRTNLCRQVADEVRSHFKDLVFRTVIPRSTRLSEAPSFGDSIFQYDKLSAGAIAYKHLSLEVIDRYNLE